MWTHLVPREWIDQEGFMPNEKFIEYARPVIEGEVKVPTMNGLSQSSPFWREKAVKQVLPAQKPDFWAFLSFLRQIPVEPTGKKVGEKCGNSGFLRDIRQKSGAGQSQSVCGKHSGPPDWTLSAGLIKITNYLKMKFTINGLILSTLVALSATAQPAPRQHPARNRQYRLVSLRPQANQPPPEMPSKEKLSYFIGMSIGRTMERDGLSNDVDVDIVATAMKDILSGKTPRFSDVEFRQIGRQLNGAMQAKRMAMRKEEEEEGESGRRRRNKSQGRCVFGQKCQRAGI